MTSFFIYVIACLVPITVVLLRHYSSSTPTTRKNPPPSPPKWPIIGNLHQLSPLVHRSFLSLSERYGRDLMLLQVGSIPSLVASTTEAAREILHTHDLVFAERPTTEPLRKLSFNYKEVGMSPYGDYWRQAKKMLVLHCLSYKQVQSYSRIRDEEIATTLNEIVKLSARNQVVNLSDLSVQHSNNISTRVTFGRKYNDGAGADNKFARVMDDYSEALRRFYFQDTIPVLGWIDRINGATRKLDATVQALDSFLEQALDDRLAKINKETNHEGGEPLIDALLRNKKSEDVGLNVDTDTTKALLLDMYVGGTQTTAALLEWTLAELLVNPDVLKKLTIELRSIVKNKHHITNDELDRMEYLKATVMETGRLHPPGPVLSTRVTTEDVNVMGFDIVKGTRVYINAWAIGRDPKAWDRPNDFMPERFMGNSINFLKHDFKLLCFGAGRRSCSGKTFALAIVEHFIANLLCNFDLVLPDGVTKDDIDLTETIGLSNRPKFALKALAKPCP